MSYVKVDSKVEVEYTIKDPYGFKIESNIKEELIPEFIADFLRSQMGGGLDDSSPNEKEVYKIKIGIDLDHDTFYCEHDTGNLCLRDGILYKVLSMLEKKNP